MTRVHVVMGFVFTSHPDRRTKTARTSQCWGWIGPETMNYGPDDGSALPIFSPAWHDSEGWVSNVSRVAAVETAINMNS